MPEFYQYGEPRDTMGQESLVVEKDATGFFIKLQIRDTGGALSDPVIFFPKKGVEIASVFLDIAKEINESMKKDQEKPEQSAPVPDSEYAGEYTFEKPLMGFGYAEAAGKIQIKVSPASGIVNPGACVKMMDHFPYTGEDLPHKGERFRLQEWVEGSWWICVPWKEANGQNTESKDVPYAVPWGPTGDRGDRGPSYSRGTPKGVFESWFADSKFIDEDRNVFFDIVAVTPKRAASRKHMCRDPDGNLWHMVEYTNKNKGSKIGSKVWRCTPHKEEAAYPNPHWVASDYKYDQKGRCIVNIKNVDARRAKNEGNNVVYFSRPYSKERETKKFYMLEHISGDRPEYPKVEDNWWHCVPIN